MQVFFESLPILLLIIYGIKKFMDSIEEKDDQEDHEGYSYEYNNQENRENIENEETDNLEYLNQIEDEMENKFKKENIVQKEKNEDLSLDKMKKASKKIEQLKTGSSSTSMDNFLSKLDKKDLVKGIVFKEILDKPRSKRPYRPLNRD